MKVAVGGNLQAIVEHNAGDGGVIAHTKAPELSNSARGRSESTVEAIADLVILLTRHGPLTSPRITTRQRYLNHNSDHRRKRKTIREICTAEFGN